MIARDNFAADVKWYTGSGCMICGSNYSIQGAEAGIQAVDFEMSDFDGRLGLCYSHAREVGVLVGMTDSANLVAITEGAEATYAAAEALRDEAHAALEAAAEEKAAVERTILSFSESLVAANSVPVLETPKAKAKPKAKVEA